jgi:hypothetical protein
MASSAAPAATTSSVLAHLVLNDTRNTGITDWPKENLVNLPDAPAQRALDNHTPCSLHRYRSGVADVTLSHRSRVAEKRVDVSQ